MRQRNERKKMLGEVRKNPLTNLFILPTDQRWEADHEGQDPKPCDQRLRSLPTHDARIADRPRDGHVAVQGDGAQVEDGGCAHPDVDGQPY